MKPRNKNGNNTKCFSRILLSGFSLGVESPLRQARNFYSRTLGLLSTPWRAKPPTTDRAVHPMALPTWTCSSERPQCQQCRNRTCPHPTPPIPPRGMLDLLSLVHSDTKGPWECVCSYQGGSEQPDHSHPEIQAQPLTPS